MSSSSSQRSQYLVAPTIAQFEIKISLKKKETKTKTNYTKQKAKKKKRPGVKIVETSKSNYSPLYVKLKRNVYALVYRLLGIYEKAALMLTIS